ncbi:MULTISPECIES: SLC13 family permease [unclassified Clostridium]|jgi:di/tricarboxylate transporter|uniref:SLC13 family permease n=1 Tax=unclassified Clostridium TaxID=2614128 RepID=UPI001FA955F4|nr:MULTISPECIES: SLC13 family permease [unclassified Clostridium]
MENMNLYIVVGVLIFMIIMFLLQKATYGVTAMTCVAILVLTGVLDFTTAFSGIINKNTILVATVMVVGNAIGKTSVTRKIKAGINHLKGKSGLILMLAMFGFTILLCQVMGQVAVLTIMFVFVQTLDDDGEVCSSRMLYLIVAMLCAWTGRFPVGMGAALPMQANAYYEGMVTDPAQTLGMFDMTKVAIIPALALTVYSLFAWRLLPKTTLDSSAVKTNQSAQKEETSISGFQEFIVFAVFFAVVIGFLFSDLLGNQAYMISVVGVLLIIYTKTMKREEVVEIMTSDMVWMIAGMLAMSSALSSSGAGEAIGNFVLKILGENPSGLKVLTVFGITTVVMTTFLSNTGSMAVLTPIAASTALAGGMDPRAVVLVVNVASWFALAFPTGCAAGTMVYAIGKYDPIKLLKFNIPYLIIAVATLIFSTNLFFPVYG